MIELTPAERRGAWIVVLLLVLGAAHDLVRARRETPAPRRPAVPEAPARRSEPPAASPVAGDTGGEYGPPRVDINRAGAEALDRLPGIGPVIARRIVEHRARHGPFRRIEELAAVQGVGPRLLERLRPLASVGVAGGNPHDSSGAAARSARPRRGATGRPIFP